MIPAHLDRRGILPILLARWPLLARATSDDATAFLNRQTGLDVAPDVPNSTAFDRWRAALAAQGMVGVWTETPGEKVARQARGDAIKIAADRGDTELPP